MFYRVSFILSIIEYKATKSQAKNREKPTAWQKTAIYLSIGVKVFINLLSKKAQKYGKVYIRSL